MFIYLYFSMFFMMNNPSIILEEKNWFQLPNNHFFAATDGKESEQKTIVQLKNDGKYLTIAFECLQNPFVEQNSYNQHNSELYKQEVFEIFIAAGEQTPTHYLELEINPNNAIFAGWIDNPTKEAPKNLQLIDYKDTKIIHSVQKKQDSWSGKMQIPWALLGSKKDIYRINFYRIISLKNHTKANWEGTPSTCAYLCWSPTMSGKIPRFHRPDFFGFLKIKK